MTGCILASVCTAKHHGKYDEKAQVQDLTFSWQDGEWEKKDHFGKSHHRANTCYISFSLISQLWSKRNILVQKIKETVIVQERKLHLCFCFYCLQITPEKPYNLNHQMTLYWPKENPTIWILQLISVLYSASKILVFFLPFQVFVCSIRKQRECRRLSQGNALVFASLNSRTFRSLLCLAEGSGTSNPSVKCITA